MKQGLTIKRCKKLFQQLTAANILFIMLSSPFLLYAQTDSTKKTEPATTEKDNSLISPSLEFISIQKADSSIDLKAMLKAKVKGSFIKLPLLKVKFILVTDTAEKDIGFAITDRNGMALVNYKVSSVIADKEGKMNFKAVFAGNKSMEAAEEKLAIKKARLQIVPVKEDSLLTVKVKLTGDSTGIETAVAKATVAIYVQRSFYPLKIGEGTTDENGEATIEIPKGLPGDAKASITLLARLDENEDYGKIESGVTLPWGVPVSDKLQESPRSLWSAHPPMWMLITFIILVGTVWGHYIVIIFELFRLRKEEPHPPPAATNS